MLTQSRLSGKFGKIVLLIFALIFGLALSEIGFRLYDRLFNYESGPMVSTDPDLGWKLLPKISVRERRLDFSTVIETNSQGIRDSKNFSLEKEPGFVRILVLGDSMTFGGQVALEETWVKRVEFNIHSMSDSARVEAINAGCNGYGSYQEMLYFEKYGIALRPDIVLVAFFFNDVGDDAYIKERLPEIQRDLRMAENHHGSEISEDRRSAPYGLKDYLKGHSRLYQFVSTRVKRIEFLRDFLVLLSLITYDKDADGPRRGPSRHLNRTFDIAYSASESDEDRELWQNSLESLSRIKLLSDSIGAQTGIIFIPESTWMDGEQINRGVGRDLRDYDPSKPTRYLTGLANSLNIPFLDLTELMKIRGGKDLYLFFDRHLNQEGHLAVAEGVSQWLVTHFLKSS